MPPTPHRPGGSTITDVARVAGVSTSTASRALAGYGAVSPAARARILAAADEVGYRPNGVARSMKTGRTNTLGAVMADIENSFFATAVRGFTDVARTEGFHVILANTDEELEAERSAVQVFQERRVDGLVVAPAVLERTDHLHAAVRAGLPLVLLDRRVPDLAVDVVQIDNVSAARETTRRVLDAGHRRVGMVTGMSAAEAEAARLDLHHGISTSKDRLDGFRDALAERGVTYRPEYVRAADFHQESARKQTVELLSLPDRPTAIFATDSTIALGVLLGIRDTGLRAPDDVSVVAFDDADWAEVVQPRLSVMAQPVYDMGTLAARCLIARVRDEPVEPTTHVLATHWIQRDSLAAPPRRRQRAAAGG